MQRRKARELALQALFQMDLAGHGLEQVLQDAVEREEDPPHSAIVEYAARVVRGVRVHMAEIDAEIMRRAREWTLDRMAAVDRNVLRIGLFELLHCPDVPESVVANEAVELAKKYSTADSGRFVNGILGALIRERGGRPQAEAQETAAAPSGTEPGE